ncbi:hypothetical protein CHS0354_039493, partial [Potamilus streckersoni]
ESTSDWRLMISGESVLSATWLSYLLVIIPAAIGEEWSRNCTSDYSALESLILTKRVSGLLNEKQGKSSFYPQTVPLSDHGGW